MKPYLRSTLQYIISVSALLTLLVLALLPLLTPLTYFLLDSSGSADRLDASSAQVHAWSDATMSQLVWGTGDFAFAGSDGQPFYSEAEASHLQTVQTMLRVFLALGLVAILAISLGLVFLRHQINIWWSISRGGRWLTIAIAVIAFLSVFGFERAWRFFHQVFFPGGNYEFDSATDHLVQLYPNDFWMGFTSIFGGVALVLALTTWVVSRRYVTRFAVSNKA